MAWFQKQKYDTLHVIRFTQTNQTPDKYILGNFKENIQEVFMKPFGPQDICRYVLMNAERNKYFGWIRLSQKKEGADKFCEGVVKFYLEFHLNMDMLNDEQVLAIVALISRSAVVRYSIGRLHIISNNPSGVGKRLKEAAKKIGYNDDWDGVLMCYEPKTTSLAEFQRKEINQWVTEYKIPLPQKSKGGSNNV